MPEPISMAIISATKAGAAAAASEGTAAVGAKVGATEVAGGLKASSEVAGSSLGRTTGAFVNELKADAPAVAETMLSRAHVSGPELSKALDTGAPADVGMSSIERGFETAKSETSGFDAVKWSDWKPSPGEVVRPEQIADRFRPLQESHNLEAYVKNLAQRDPGFAQELGRRAQQIKETQTPADRDAAFQQIRKTTAGKLGESIATDSFKPFFDKVDYQSRVETANGVTIVDARLMGAKNPIILGRGSFVPEGGKLAMEVKTGQPAYLEREVQHISERQVPGHLAMGDNSIVVVSRDIYAMGGERAARNAVGDAGSHVMALLPEKGIMDKALVRVVSEYMERI